MLLRPRLVSQHWRFPPKFPANPTLAATINGAATPLGNNQVRLQAMLLLQPFSTMIGNTALQGNFQIEVKGLENVRIGSVNPFSSTPPPAPSANGTIQAWQSENQQAPCLSEVRRGSITALPTPLPGLLHLHIPLFSPRRGINWRVNGWSNPGITDIKGRYPFVSNPFTISAFQQLGGRGGLSLGSGGSGAPATISLSVPAETPIVINIYANKPQRPHRNISLFGANLERSNSYQHYSYSPISCGAAPIQVI